MGIFNFFSDKSNKPAETEGPAEAHHTLVAIEWTKIKDLAHNLQFLEQFDTPLVWFFERRPDLDGEEALVGLPYTYHIIEIPRDERNSTVFIANSVLFEVLTRQNLRKAIFVSANNQFRGTVEFLKSKGFDADTLLFETPAELKAQAPNNRQQMHPGRTPQTEGRPQRGAVPQRQVGQNRIPQAVNPEVEQHAVQISQMYNERFLLGEVYPKSKFGVLIKHATGKTNEEVFLSKSAKVFINGLMHKGLVEEVDTQNLRILAPLQLGDIRSIINFAHKRAVRKPATAQPPIQRVRPQNSPAYEQIGFNPYAEMPDDEPEAMMGEKAYAVAHEPEHQTEAAL